MNMSPARTVAREAVTRVRERGSYAHETLATLLADRDLDRRDTAFATRLAYGTIAYRGTLDESLSRHVRTRGGLDPVVGDCLALSSYEILLLRTPDRAAVSEGVELVRAVCPQAAGLANAVLRRVAESAADFPWGDPDTDVEALARLHGHPLWIASMWIDELGHDAATAVMAADNDPAPLFLSVVAAGEASNRSVEWLVERGIHASLTPLDGCLLADEPAAAVKSEAVRSREVLVVDAGAQFAAMAVPLPESGSVVEIGAGRGSKTLLMAARAVRSESDVDFTAVDLHAHKLERLERDAEALGYSNVTTLVLDATDPAGLAWPNDPADAVLVDSPCSGLGTLRRHPDRRWRVAPDDIESVACVGEALLSRAASLVKPGGFVVYSTCTITKRENEQVMRTFLATEQGAQFETDPLDDEVPEVWESFLTPEGWYRSVPAAGGPDGHFVARIRRVE